MRSEADPRPILEALHERGLPLCLPAIVDKHMIFRRWAPYEPIVPGGFGTLVPAPAEPQAKPAILIVPLAAFDRRGYRIGYGKGYYDRALAELGPTGQRSASAMVHRRSRLSPTSLMTGGSTGS